LRGFQARPGTRGGAGPQGGGGPLMLFSKDTRKTIRRILSYIFEAYRVVFILVLFFILFSALANVAGALFLETLIDVYIIPLMGAVNPDFVPLFWALVVMAGIYLVGVVSNLLFNRIMVTISQGVQKTIRDSLFAHMQRLPIRYFDTNPHGDLMSRFSNDVDALRNLLGQSVPVMVTTLVSLVLTFAAMLYMSWVLTIFVVAMVALNLSLSTRLGKRSGKFFMVQQKAVGKVNAHIEEIVGSQKVVKVFNHEEESRKAFDVLNEEFEDSSANANTYANMFMPLMLNLGSLQYVVIAIAGGFLAISGVGVLTLGVIASFLQLSRAFTAPLGNLSMQINNIVMALAGATRIFEVMDEKAEGDEGEVILEKADERWVWSDGGRTVPLLGNVVLDGVHFGYTEEKEVLHDIGIYANPGEKIAIVGATGAGKTTITNLLNRFYSVQKGQILFDGIDIVGIGKAHLRKSLGIVLQDTNLFTDTIKENIRYGNLSASDEEVYAAAKLANAHDFIQVLPQGYDTLLSDAGAELSQGQRQLLSIARAAIADSPVMVLDEATSSIDTRTELIVQEGMDKLMEGRTVFVIAHRLSTIKNADAIVVMAHGKIIERGTHESLLRKKGRYYEMYAGSELEVA